MNVDMLKEAIKRKNMNVEQVATAIDIDRSTFYRKIDENRFTVKEAKALMTLLDLTGQEFQLIFFGSESQISD